MHVSREAESALRQHDTLDPNEAKISWRFLVTRNCVLYLDRGSKTFFHTDMYDKYNITEEDCIIEDGFFSRLGNQVVFDYHRKNIKLEPRAAAERKIKEYCTTHGIVFNEY